MTDVVGSALWSMDSPVLAVPAVKPLAPPSVEMDCVQGVKPAMMATLCRAMAAPQPARSSADILAQGAVRRLRINARQIAETRCRLEPRNVMTGIQMTTTDAVQLVRGRADTHVTSEHAARRCARSRVVTGRERLLRLVTTATSMIRTDAQGNARLSAGLFVTEGRPRHLTRARQCVETALCQKASFAMMAMLLVVMGAVLPALWKMGIIASDHGANRVHAHLFAGTANASAQKLVMTAILKQATAAQRHARWNVDMAASVAHRQRKIRVARNVVTVTRLAMKRATTITSFPKMAVAPRARSRLDMHVRLLSAVLVQGPNVFGLPGMKNVAME